MSKKEFFTTGISFSTRDIDKVLDHSNIINDKVDIKLNQLLNNRYDDLKVICVLNELSFPDGNFTRKSIVLLCEGIKKEE
jgi:hypothetical protein